MNNILAAKVLMSRFPEITDNAYKVATEIAIETLFQDALEDWHKMDTGLSALEYLGLTLGEYDYWVVGNRDKRSYYYIRKDDEKNKKIKELELEYKEFIKTEKGQQWMTDCKNRNNGQTGDCGDYIYDFYPEVLM